MSVVLFFRRFPLGGIALLVLLTLGTMLYSAGTAPAAESCTSPNPYYAPSVCSSGTPLKPPWVKLALGHKCHRANFKVRPRFKHTVVRHVTVWAAGKRVGTLHKGPFVFKITAKHLRRGRHFNVKMYVLLSSGQHFFKKSHFKMCGTAKARH